MRYADATETFDATRVERDDEAQDLEIEDPLEKGYSETRQYAPDA